MDILALAVPFFLIALILEMIVDRVRGTGYFRSSDAINSLSAGTLSTTIGYFTNLIPAVVWAYLLRDYSILDLDPADFDLSTAGLVRWLVALIAFDFCFYWAHRFGHEISVLWAAHAVHHQSEDYNLSTALRQTSSSFLFSWVLYTPLFLLGMPFEVFLTVNAIDLIYQFWVHTQHIRRLGWMEKVFVTPSNHRVHHAQNEIYIDKNYGGVLILWDRLFGTFQDELESEPVIFGVRKALRSWNPFWANLQVYDYLWFDAWRTEKWRDKIGIWFRRTGWRPADMEARFPKQKVDRDAFEKFDPQIAPGIRRYVIGQFMVAILMVLWIGQIYATQDLQAVLIPCVLLWTLLYSLGQFNEGRHAAGKFEVFRLLLVMPLGCFGLLQGVLSGMQAANLWLALAVYLGASLVLLRPAWQADLKSI